MFDLGFKDKKLIEFLLFVLKQQDKIKEVIEIISKEKDKINKKYQLLEIFERPAIPVSKNEIEIIRKNAIEKINRAITDNNLKLNIDDQYLDPPMFYYSYDNEDNLELSKKLNELFKKTYLELQKNFESKSNNKKKIKIGFISEFFNNHTIEKLFKGLIFNLDITLFDVNVFYLDNGKGFSKEFLQEEEKNKIKNFKLPKLFKEKVDLILSQNLDIVFYPDIGMSSQLYYLTFLRLGKYQITSWGHPETTGNSNIDYFISSKLLEINKPDAQKHYSEKLILCDYLPMYLSKPNIKKINDDEIKSNNIYSCPQTLFKLHPDFDEVIFKIIKKDKKAKIFFIKDKNESFYKKIFNRIQKKLSREIDRISFISQLEKTEYIHHCGRASVLLDPFYFGAGNSFHESMVYGTPTVTMPTKYLKTKIVQGAYKQMQIEKPPVVDNIEDYVSVAIEIANMEQNKLLEIKKYYSESAEKNLFENKGALKSFQNVMIDIAKKN
jgi:predicted O-linked N-acetylglucosamine transferase (SPINDLY family)